MCDICEVQQAYGQGCIHILIKVFCFLLLDQSSCPQLMHPPLFNFLGMCEAGVESGYRALGVFPFWFGGGVGVGWGGWGGVFCWGPLPKMDLKHHLSKGGRRHIWPQLMTCIFHIYHIGEYSPWHSRMLQPMIRHGPNHSSLIMGPNKQLSKSFNPHHYGQDFSSIRFARPTVWKKQLLNCCIDLQWPQWLWPLITVVLFHRW